MRRDSDMKFANRTQIHRRDVLAGLSAVGVGAIAGCSGNGDSDSDGGGTDDGSSGGSSSNQHSVGESFTVGSGAKSIRYVVTEATLARAIGTASFNVEADGVYLVVRLSMENTGNETIDISSRHLRAVDSDGREFDADTSASTYIGQDDRFDAEGILFEQLQPGLEQTRVIPFDVAPGNSYSLRVDPAGIFSGAETHYVGLGNAPASSGA